MTNDQTQLIKTIAHITGRTKYHNNPLSESEMLGWLNHAGYTAANVHAERDITIKAALDLRILSTPLFISPKPIRGLKNINHMEKDGIDRDLWTINHPGPITKEEHLAAYSTHIPNCDYYAGFDGNLFYWKKFNSHLWMAHPHTDLFPNSIHPTSATPQETINTSAAAKNLPHTAIDSILMQTGISNATYTRNTLLSYLWATSNEHQRINAIQETINAIQDTP